MVLIDTAYNGMYIIEPGASVKVEAMPDTMGLKIGLVYDVIPDRKELRFVRFTCKNDSVLNISEMNEDDVSWYGGEAALKMTIFNSFCLLISSFH